MGEKKKDVEKKMKLEGKEMWKEKGLDQRDKGEEGRKESTMCL